MAKKVSLFREMIAARKEACEKGTKTAKKALTTAKKAYREDAKAKGKTTAEIKATVEKYGTGCPVSITGTKRKTAAKKTTTRKTTKKRT